MSFWKKISLKNAFKASPAKTIAKKIEKKEKQIEKVVMKNIHSINKDLGLSINK